MYSLIFSVSTTIVKSRYLQSAEKSSLSKVMPSVQVFQFHSLCCFYIYVSLHPYKQSSSLTESFAMPLRPSSPKSSGVKPKLGTPPRRSIAPQALGTCKCFQLGWE